jgi:predicted transcriptional regulator
MARPRSTHPTDAELEILHVLWKTGPAGLGTVHAELSGQREVAKTTVATMLTLMLQKKLVRRSKGSHGYLWSAAVTREETASGMVGSLIDRVFDGSAQRMVAHLVEAGEISQQELDELLRLVSRQRKAAKRSQKKR